MTRRARIALLLGGFATTCGAGVVEIAWDADGRFATTQTIEPGRVGEVCGPIAAGQSVRWRFEADAPLDFNIHFHVGPQVRYPVRRTGVARDAGTLRAASAQDYCWMWTGRAGGATAVELKLER